MLAALIREQTELRRTIENTAATSLEGHSSDWIEDLDRDLVQLCKRLIIVNLEINRYVNSLA